MERRYLGGRIASLYASIVIVVVAVGGVTTEQAPSTSRSKTTSVLFMCPHGAAKSVLASAYFERYAKERGLNVRVVSAGTDPDDSVAPAVAAHLAQNGYAVPAAKPRRATPADFAGSDLVISIGCDVKELPAKHAALIDWSDVPDLSAGFAMADAKLRERVMQLVDELVSKQQ